MKCQTPGCDNDGTITESEHGCGGDPDRCYYECPVPVPVQCEWCFMTPESDRNLKRTDRILGNYKTALMQGRKHNENCYGDPHCGCFCGLKEELEK